MSLISATNKSISAWEPIQATAEALRQGCAGLEHSLEEVFQEVDAMRQELLERFQDVHKERHQLADREAELDKQLQEAEQQVQEAEKLRTQFNQRSQELEEVTAELASLRSELEHVRQDATEAQAADDAQQQLTTLQQAVALHQKEAEQLRRERDELRQEITEVQSSAGSAAKVRNAQSDSKSDAPATISESASTNAAITLSAEQLSAMHEEREALETELELVRNRAAELNETVTEQQLEMVKRQTEMGGELQQLRRLVDKQADLFVEGDAEEAVSRDGGQQADEAKTPAPDPVVNSVMAQFTKLQKDVAQRRRKR